ncbi:hypothetical protein GJAV_G00200530 [Gymnothorax javanicus]|nr:hypothetical protein GJAV_G00200530 [Gymnothorax javanicus]
MGDQAVTKPQVPSPFHGFNFPLLEGQRSGQHFCSDGLKEPGQLGAGAAARDPQGHLSISSSSSSDGIRSGRNSIAWTHEGNEGACSWMGPSLIHTQVDVSAGRFGGGQGRNLFQSEGYSAKWPLAHRRHLGRGSGACEQKLDSFTEAFARRSPSIAPVQNGGHGGRGGPFSTISGLVMSRVNGRLDAAETAADSSAPLPPLLLSPPPTPLSFTPLSPPRRSHFQGAEVTQSVQLMQADAPCTSRQTYFPQSLSQPTHSSGPTLSGMGSLLDWMPQPGDLMGNRDPSYPQLQDRDSPLIYPGEEFGQRNAAFAHEDVFRNTDECSLQTPISSPQGQHPLPCVSFQPDHNLTSSCDHVTSWNQVSDRGLPLTHNHLLTSFSSCSVLSTTQAQNDGFRPVDEDKQYFWSWGTVSGAQCPTKVKNGSHLNYSQLPFPSNLQIGRVQDAVPHYSPRPMLNPIRRGSGLYCNLLPLSYLQSHFSDRQSLWPEDDCLPPPQVNLGPEFQAVVPPFQENKASGHWPEDTPTEQLLWKPWEGLEENSDIQEQVENLLDLCSSSAMPGGGTNLELALHCLSRCQGDMLATVEMLMLSTPSSEDYHYCGSDVWKLSEKRLFNKAIDTHSKDFSLIQRTVKTKSVSQCVEFYYHSKKIADRQRRQQEWETVVKEERIGAADSDLAPVPHTLVKPLMMEEPIRSSLLASSFPCKQCGKMFYKIKSRNAHMKIHRQQQEDWRERAHPNQVLSPSLTQNIPQNQARLSFLPTPNNHMSSINNTTPDSASNVTALPLFAPAHPTWEPFEMTPDSSTFYCDSDGKVLLGVAGTSKSQVHWQ